MFQSAINPLAPNPSISIMPRCFGNASTPRVLVPISRETAGNPAYWTNKTTNPCNDGLPITMCDRFDINIGFAPVSLGRPAQVTAILRVAFDCGARCLSWHVVSETVNKQIRDRYWGMSMWINGLRGSLKRRADAAS